MPANNSKHGRSDAGHHHRSTVKGHKPFKSRHASKSQIKAQTKGKVEEHKCPGPGTKRSSNKFDRKNHAKQIQINKRAEVIRANRIFEGRNAAPKVVAIISLCADIDVEGAVQQLNSSVGCLQELESKTSNLVNVQRFKQSLHYLTPQRDLLQMIDCSKVADYVVFLMSATQEVDALGELTARSIQSQGVSSVVAGVANLEAIEPSKLRPDVKKSLLSFIKFFFPKQEKVYGIDSPSDASNVVRLLASSHPSGIHWRDSRSYLLADDVSYEGDQGLISIKGIVRGRNLNPNRTVHLTGYGDCAIERIESLVEPSKRNQRSGLDQASTTSDVWLPSADGDETFDEQFPDDPMSESYDEDGNQSKLGVRFDDHHYFDDAVGGMDEEGPKLVPKGTSRYQASWVPADTTDEDEGEESDTEYVEFNPNQGSLSSLPHEADHELLGIEPASSRNYDEGMEAGTLEGGEDPEGSTEMHMDLADEEQARQLEQHRQRKTERDEDLEFPDEVDLDPDESARHRLRKYRGLKSLRNSEWDPWERDDNMPDDWSKLLHFENYRKTCNKVLKTPEIIGPKPGTRAVVYLKDCSSAVYDDFRTGRSIQLFSLFPHERQSSASNYIISPHSEYEEPVKSKDNLVLQVGPRRLQVSPIFSAPKDSASTNNVAKFDRYLRPGGVSVASIVGPTMIGNVPAIFYKQTPEGLKIVATGSYLNSDASRVIVKRIVLTGHPFKIHKKLVTIRFMFFNPQDVNWFKAIPLFTKHGRTGFIKESLGQHGYFKATFDGTLKVQDTVAMPLYKRVYPKKAESFH